MGKNPFAEIAAGQSINDVVKAALGLSAEQLGELAERLDDQQCVTLLLWASTELRSRGVKAALIHGCILNLCRAAVADNLSRKQRFDTLLNDLGLSETQAYRLVAMWECFGDSLLSEPELIESFVVESLKLLSAPSVSNEVRESSLDFAKAGNRISIRTAKALIAGKSPGDEEPLSISGIRPSTDEAQDTEEKPQSLSVVSELASPTEIDQPTIEDPFHTARSLIQKLVRFVFDSRQQWGQQEVTRLIGELESALARLRKELHQSAS